MRFVDIPTERTTAATDLLLAAAALGGIAYLRSRPDSVPADTLVWSWAFALLAVSATLGAAYHGLVLDGTRRGALWQALTFCLALEGFSRNLHSCQIALFLRDDAGENIRYRVDHPGELSS